jgi:hypothetical protein
MPALIDHNGYVHVAYIGYDQKLPRKNITAFRTDVKTRDLEMNYAPIKDISVQREHSYYRITRAGARFDQSLTLYTVGEGNIMIYQDITLPKVRTGIKTRWNGDKGQWEKELKSGWCMA